MNANDHHVGLRCSDGYAGGTTLSAMLLRPLFSALAALVLLAATVALPAQTAATGSISGRVFNPATSEYIRNVEITVAGTNLSAQTEGNGFYRLHNVPEGEVTLNVTYPGYNPVTEKLTVKFAPTVPPPSPRLNGVATKLCEPTVGVHAA